MKFIGRLVVIFVLVLVALLIVVSIVVSMRKGHVPDRAILELNLETGLVEDVPDDPFAKAMVREPVVRDVVEALDRAGNDSRVAGVVARVGAANIGLAQVQEVRDAIARFRGKKKFAIAFSETFGEGNNGTGAYYLATAFEQIYLQPSGDVYLTGLMLQSPFIRGTLEKLGMRFHGDHRYEYKNAMNLFTEKKFTPAHREAMQKVLDSYYGQLVRGIAQARNLPEDQVKALIDKGPFLGQEAVDAKLVDRLGYRDEVYAEAKKRAGEGAELLYAGKYLERAGRPHEKGQTIALVYGVGGVARGKSGYDPVFGDTRMGSETVAKALRDAADDKDVKAILFRVDSPGGSYVASDTIWREVVRAREKGKPVIVSMGNVAGSGGYFVAMAADKIVAQPGTITGSIGVLSGKMLMNGLYDKLGLSFDDVAAGAHARYYSSRHDYSPSEWARFQATLDRIYADFTTKVAEGRKLPKEKVLEVAKGRIWTGEDAKALGLVDELGGFDVALKAARQAAKVPEDEGVNLKLFPKKKGTYDMLFGESPESSEDQAASVLAEMLSTIQPVARQLQRLGLVGPPAELEMPVR